MPEDDLPEIAAIFGQIGSTLATIAVNEAVKKPEQPKSEIVPPDTEIVGEIPIS